MKRCTKCGVDLPLTDFHKRTRSKDGLMAQCKICVNNRIKANYNRDPTKKKAATARYHAEHPEWSKKVLRDWHVANRDRRWAQTKERLKTDPAFLQYRRAMTAQSEQRRRALKAGSSVERISTEQYNELLLRYDSCCWICEQPLDKVFWDHYIPLAKGGPHVASNLRPSCNPCNTRKNSTWPFTEVHRLQIAKEVRALNALTAPIADHKGLEVPCHP